MNNRILFIIFGIIVISNIIITINRSRNDSNNINACKKVNYYLSSIIVLYIFYIKFNIITEAILRLLSKITVLESVSMNVLEIVLLLGTFFIAQKILYVLLNKIILYFVKEDNENKFSLYSVSMIFAVTKSVLMIGIIFIGVMIYDNLIGTPIKLEVLNDTAFYEKLQEYMPQSFDEIDYENASENDITIPSSYIITYYNGVTLEEGIKSNKEIDKKAKEINQYTKTDIEKARNIYSWIGNNTEYDYKKAEEALRDTKNLESGAIIAFNEQSGICFDFACLYIAMARAVDLEVRLVTGSAFDGTQYGPHAWNEVYISEEKKWIPVDPTFYLAGDYFNNDDFYSDHIKEGIAGEW